MTTTSPPLNEEFIHKAAIALNNIAVTLLHRQCYREAMESFKNAFQLLKVCLNPELRCELTYKKMNASLDIASGHMINAFQIERKHDIDGFHLNVLSYDRYRDFQALKDAANGYESDFMGYAIVICHDESVQSMTSQSHITSLQTESAIILNNMTTSCMSFGYKFPRSSKNSIESNNIKRRNQLYKRGFELGTTAYEVLLHQLHNERDYTTSRYQSALTSLILKNLMRITFYLNDIQKSREFYVQLARIRDDAAFIEATYDGDDLFQSFLAPVA